MTRARRRPNIVYSFEKPAVHVLTPAVAPEPRSPSRSSFHASHDGPPLANRIRAYISGGFSRRMAARRFGITEERVAELLRQGSY